MIAARVLALVLLLPGPAQLALAQAAPAQGAQAAAGRVQRGILVRPDTVTVGDPFEVVVRVRAPRGSTISFPEPPAPEPTADIEPIDPRAVTQAADSGAVEQTARYRLVAWNVGRLPITLDDIVVQTPSGEQRLSLEGTSVFVRSVLPADSAERVPKPARELFAPVRPLWLYWLIAATVALILALFAWWYWRRRRRRSRVGDDPLAAAEREFDRIEALRLVEAGERGRHVALMIDVLRDYLAARYPAAVRSLTSWELLSVAARSLRNVPTSRLEALLGEADLVKFARRPVTMDRARELGREARAIVRQIDAAERAAAEADAQARDAAGRPKERAA